MARFEKCCQLLRMQEGKCFWCGKEMVLRYTNGGGVWPNEITIDHLDERLSPDRGQHPGEWRRVGACGECNKRRNDEATRDMPIDALNMLSQMHKHRRKAGS